MIRRVLEQLIDQLKRREDLTAEQVNDAVAELIRESVAAGIKAEFLAALAGKGETVVEIATFAMALREKSVIPLIDDETRAGAIIDVCGTGGDKLHTYNISTAVSIIVAAAGVRVAKHGNRAITSKSGSADVLDALGIKTNLTPEQAAGSLKEHGFAFFFAPLYHPAFKHIAPARKLCAEKGQRTLFNFLGPLLNPARPSAQLIGIPDPSLCQPLAQVLQSLGIRHGMVVSGGVDGGWLDELSTLGENAISEYRGESSVVASRFRFDPARMQRATLADLVGGDKDTNAEIVRRVLSGKERGPKRDIALLNAGAALFVAGHSTSIDAGWDAAAEIVDGGRATAKLRALTTV